MRRRVWVVLGAVGLGLVVVPVVATAPLPSGSLVDVADRFAPVRGASLMTDVREPRRLFCLGAQACPSVSRAWLLDEAPETGDVQEWLDEAAYDAQVEGDCSSGSCRARGSAEEWGVTLFLTTPDPDGSVRLSLSVRP